LRMRSSKTRTSESLFRWQQCSECLKSIPSTSENHQCSDESIGIFVESNRARLNIQEHKTGISISTKTII